MDYSKKIQNQDDVFCSNISIGNNHNSAILEYVNDNNLPIKINLDDYHTGPCLMAELGYLVIKSENNSSLLVFYIPKNISKDQLEWFFSNQYIFLQFVKIGAYSLNNEWQEIYGIDNIKKELLLKEKNGMKLN